MPFQFRKEAIEEDLNSNFPSQGQGNPPLYYSLSEVVVPTYSINQSAEGSQLPQNLQTAWDFSTGHNLVTSGSTTIISNPGFWQIDLSLTGFGTAASAVSATLAITDGLTSKEIYQVTTTTNSPTTGSIVTDDKLIVFVRSGDSVTASVSAASILSLNVWYRQIAAVNGDLVSPLGYSAA